MLLLLLLLLILAHAELLAEDILLHLKLELETKHSEEELPTLEEDEDIEELLD